MHAEGHQIASHTWSHQNASQLTNTQFTNQMVWNEIALNSILGFFPTYMRPPYSICEKNCQNILSKLGYHIIYFDLDTEGYLNDDPTLIQNSKDIWDQAVDGSDPTKDSFLQIEHDIHYQTVYNLTDYILTSLFELGYRSVTVGECLGDPASNWYRAGPSGTNTSKPTPPTRTTASVAPTRTGVSVDGSCGNGVTCAGSRFGTCCSAYGYCGTTDDYCSLDNGCQVAWGSCDGAGTTTSITTGTTISTRSTSLPSTSTAPPAQTGLAVSTDGRCGAEVQETCAGSSFGPCCSPAGKCSSNTISCLALLGCQKAYGTCI
ncbi:carbohydrate esterase family 4 protein [Thermothielavioides terrestris NRRL 8126]|uniref:Carbohydrate esterase family 4 protein n=1 Tax=Thermothielavioides terrestris (strain ATCC 38088 / NRRL 8126) TaxID=578455 RepID=G2RBV4_THETT|nr:carbohydrate esterase family 4 protein [Thermothielavioides terrestris NRRL 8126]AEO69275.1 carbohydrate esterase family 4 protein [Thermothielavioides terrestris NRRL 8126]